MNDNDTDTDNQQLPQHQKEPANASKIPSSTLYHLGKIAVPCLVHILLHQSSSRLFGRFLAKRFPRLKPKDLLYLHEKFPSTVNSICTFLGAIHVLKSFRGNAFSPYTKQIDLLFGAMVGFMTYDLGVMAIRGKEHISVWIHHVLGIAGATGMMYFRVGSYFPACFIVPEITVTASNLLWILDKLNLVGTRFLGLDIYQAALWVRVVLFAIFRAPSLPACLLGAIKSEAQSISPIPTPSPKSHPTTPPAPPPAPRKHLNQAIANFIEKYKALPPFVSIFTAINLTVFGVLNSYWSVLVLRALLRYRSKSLITKTHHF